MTVMTTERILGLKKRERISLLARIAALDVSIAKDEKKIKKQQDKS